MKATDPIIVLETLWTKVLIVDYMDDVWPEELTPDDISYEDAVWWIKKENVVRFQAISYGEDYYGRTMADYNKELIRRTSYQVKVGS